MMKKSSMLCILPNQNRLDPQPSGGSVHYFRGSMLLEDAPQLFKASRWLLVLNCMLRH